MQQEVLKKEVDSLPVKLTSEELLEIGQDLAKALGEVERLEDKKKSAAARFKEDIDEQKLEANRLSRLVRTGEKYAGVEVTWFLDWPKKRAVCVREDTGEQCKSRPLTKGELEHYSTHHLFTEKAEAGSDDGDGNGDEDGDA